MTNEEALAHFTQWKTAYQLAFGGVDKSAALADLSAFCREHQTCVVPGDRDQTLVMEGRRQAILRIRNFLTLTPEELVNLHTIRPATGAISHD